MKTHIYEFYKGGVATLNEKLKEFRMRAGLTQFQVGKLLNVDPSAVSNWERGINPPLGKYRAKLCQIYGVSMAELNEALKE